MRTRVRRRREELPPRTRSSAERTDDGAAHQERTTQDPNERMARAQALGHHPRRFAVGSATETSRSTENDLVAAALARAPRLAQVQRANGGESDSEDEAVPTQAEIDRGVLNAARNRDAPAIVQAQRQMLVGRLSGAARHGLRRFEGGALAAGRQGVQAAQPPGAAADHLRDVKAAEAEIAGASMQRVLSTKAGQMAQNLADQARNRLRAAVDAAYDNAGRRRRGTVLGFGGRAETDPEMEARVRAEGHAAAARRGELLLPLLRRRLDQDLGANADALRDELGQGVEAQAQNLVDIEVGDRANAQNEVAAAIQAPVQTYSRKLEADLRNYLENKVGAGGARFWRSAELRAFRARMKSAGRATARQEATQELPLALPPAMAHMPATQRYALLRAKQKIHKAAKDPVNEALREMADRGTRQLLPAGVTELEAAASTAAWGVLRRDVANVQDPRQGAAARARATSALKAFYTGLWQRKRQEARTWKNGIIKNVDLGTRDNLQQQEEQAVNQKVQQSHVGRDTIRTVLAGETPGKALSLFGHMLDTVVPNSGDSISLDIELRIPIPQTPAFILLGIKGQANRGRKGSVNAAPDQVGSDDWLEVRGDFTIGGGVEFVGLRADAALDFFARAGADGTADTTKALSYGIYRFAAGKSEKLARFWAGQKIDGISHVEQAETWAAMVEEQAFEDAGTFVDLGVVGRLRGQANLGAVSGSAQLGGGTFRRYNRAAITDAGEAVGGAVANRVDADRRRRAIQAKKLHVLTGKATVKAGILGQDVTFTITANAVIGGPWEVQISASVPLPSGPGTAGLTGGIVEGSLNGLHAIKGLVKRASDGESSAGKESGSVIDALGQIVRGIPQLDNALLEATAKAWTVDKAPLEQGAIGEAGKAGTKAGLSLGTQGKLNLIFGRVPNPAAARELDRWVIRGELSDVQQVKASIGVASFNLQRGRALLSLGWQLGQWKYTVL